MYVCHRVFVDGSNSKLGKQDINLAARVALLESKLSLLNGGGAE
jgi:hypothetical protein